MSLDPSIEDQQRLAETFARSRNRLSRRERVVDGSVGAVLLLVIAAVWLHTPPGSFEVLPALASLAIFILASQVEFDTPLGHTVATQIAFVPLLFSLPLALVPLAVIIGVAANQVPRVRAGEISWLRMLRAIPNSWFVVGPVVVLAVAGVAPRHADALWLVLALLAQFGVDFGVYYVRSWLMRSAGLIEQLRDTWIYGVDAALSIVGLLVAEDLHRHPIVSLAPIPLLGILAMFGRERHHRLESVVELNSAYRGTALVLGDVVEADDGYTGEHCRMVVGLALAVGSELGLNATQTRDLEFGALLHDVGKVAVPKEIINKPGKLDDREWEIMKTHATEGQKMLDQVGGFMTQVGRIVRSHHERWDGGGYPDGLAGEAIPLPARIITCCDSWNAMRTDRAYRGALPFEVARDELLTHRGRQFDPRVVDAFLTVVTSPEDEAGAMAAVIPLQTPLTLTPMPAPLPVPADAELPDAAAPVSTGLASV